MVNHVFGYITGVVVVMYSAHAGSMERDLISSVGVFWLIRGFCGMFAG